MADQRNPSNPAGGLRVAFVLAYLAGAGVIAASVFEPLELALVVGVPNAAMLVYALVYAMRRRSPYLVEPFADSLFYLGFLFTVTSLVGSLLPYALETATPSVESILAKLGVALTTTLLGLIGRVCFRQFAMSVDLAEAEVQASLFDRTQEFGRQLDALIEQFDSTVGRLNSDLEQTVNASVKGIELAGQTGVQELRDTAEAARESLSHSTGAIVEQLETQMQQAFRRSHTSIDEFGQSMDALSDRAATALEPFSVEMQSMVAELGNVREAAVRNEARITQIFESYEMMITKLRDAQEVGDRYQEVLGNRIAALVTALESALQSIQTMSGDTQSVLGGLAKEIEGVRDARAALSADAAALAGVRETLGKLLDEATTQPADPAETDSDSDIEPFAIEDDAFEDIKRPGGEDEVYIPRLRGHRSRSKGPA